MVEMISQESMAPNKPQEKKTVRYIEFGQFKESNHHKGYPKIPKLKISFLCISAMVMIFLIAGSFNPFQFNSVRAESGLGANVFKVILTIIGADKANTGDVVALVTVNDHSRVKFFNVVDNSVANGLVSKGNISNISSDSDNQNKLIEYVATFPNVTVNTGDEYKTCVLPLKTLKINCVEGTNSLAKRPEVVDLSLNSITQSPEADTTQSSLTLSSTEDDRNTSTDNDRDKEDKKGDR
jgi:hypothetical protein